MATLVTGATGFTGSHLVRRLVDEGESVVAFVRPTSRTGLLKALGVECRVVDIRDSASVEVAFEPFSRVFHLAAAFRTQHADVREFRRVNVEGTRNILESARRMGVQRFLHCSTVGIQGGIDDPPADEEYRGKPGDVYQESKLEGELAVRRLIDEDGFPVTIVRPAGIYGPGDQRFLKLFRLIGRRRFVMIGSGETLYHLTYVDDMVEGMLLAATRPEAVGQVFTIAGPSYTTLRELVDLIADILEVPRPRLRLPPAPVQAAAFVCDRVLRAVGLDPPLYPRRVEFFVKNRAFDISKARRLLGYEPEVDLEEGLARTAAWYRAEGLL